MAGEKFPVGLIIKVFDEATAPLKKINDSLNKFKAPLQVLNNKFRALAQASGLSALGASVGKVGTSVNQLGASVFSLGTKFALLGGAAAVGLGKIVNGTVEASSKLVDLSDATGASVDSIQRLGFAWQQSGGDAESFEAGLKKFAIALGQARKNTGPLVDGLKKIDPGLFKELLGTKETGDAFRIFIKGLSKAKTDAGRLALATKIVGKTANTAAAILGKNGTEALKLLEMETPGVIAEEDARRAEAFGDTLTKLKASVSGLFNIAVGPLIPVLDEISKTLMKDILGSEPEVRAWARAFASELPGRLKSLRDGFLRFWDAIAPLRGAFKWLISDSGRVKVALIGLAAIMSSQVIMSALSLTGSLIGLAFNFGRVAISAGVLLAPLAKIGAVLAVGVAWFSAITVAATLAGRVLGGAIWDQATVSAQNFLQILQKIWSTVQLLSGVTLLKGLFKGDVVGEYRATIGDLTKPMSGQAPKQFSQLWGEALKSVGQSAQDVAATIPGLQGSAAVAGPVGFLKKKSLFQQSGFFAPPAPPSEVPTAELGAAEMMPRVIRQESVQKAEISVKFNDLPRGTRVTTDKNPALALNLDLGYAMEAV